MKTKLLTSALFTLCLACFSATASAQDLRLLGDFSVEYAGNGEVRIKVNRIVNTFAEDIEGLSIKVELELNQGSVPPRYNTKIVNLSFAYDGVLSSGDSVINLDFKTPIIEGELPIGTYNVFIYLLGAPGGVNFDVQNEYRVPNGLASLPVLGNLTATREQAGVVKVRWDTPDPRYDSRYTISVYRSTSLNSIGSVAIALRGGSSSFNDVKPAETPGVIYYYRLRTRDGFGHVGAYSDVARGSTQPALPAPVPSGRWENGTSIIEWPPVTGAVQYEVTHQDPSVYKTKIESTSYRQPFYPDGLNNYSVRACRQEPGSCGAESNVVTITAPEQEPPAQDDNPPATPTMSLATGGTYADRVELEWTSVTGAESYRVYRSTSSGANGSQIATTGQNETSYEDYSIDAGVTYYYRVQACNGSGCSDYSRPLPGWLGEDESTVPNTPIITFASADTGSEFVYLDWTVIDEANRYEVYRSTNQNDNGSKLADTTDNFYRDYAVEPGTPYYYRVKACNDAGCSDFSAFNEGSIKEEAGAIPKKPSITRITKGNGRQLRMAWSEVDTATFYKVQRANCSKCSFKKVAKRRKAKFTDTKAKPGKRFTYRVKACNANGCSKPSRKVSGFSRK